MTRIAALASSLALAGGALAGCGDDDSGGGGGYGGAGGKAKPATTATESNASPAGTSSEPVQIGMKDTQYHPRNVAVHEGQKVRWTNDDTVAHTVNGRTGADLDSGTMKPGIKAFYETTMRNAGKV